MNDGIHKLQIVDLIHKPFSLIKQSVSLGIKGVKRFFMIVFLFAICNLIMDIYAIVSFVTADYNQTKLINLLLLIVTGIAITAFAGYKAYQYLLINAAQFIYVHSKERIEDTCYNIILKADLLFKSETFKNKTQSEGLQATASLITDFYEKQSSFIKKGLHIILNRIPMASILLNLRTDILNGNHKETAQKLCALIDDFVSQNIFEANNTKWVGWLLPTNILLFYLWIDLVIG